jgi:hypothetical protein
MVEMMFVLVLVSCFAEYKLVISWDALYKIMSHDTYKLPLIGKEINTKMIPLMFSMCLSMLLGMMFGAAGLIVFVGGLASTACMQPVYAMMRNGTWDRTGNYMQTAKAKVNATVSANKSSIVGAWQGLVKIVMIPVTIIAAIIAFIMVVLNFINDPKGTTKAGVKRIVRR